MGQLNRKLLLIFLTAVIAIAVYSSPLRATELYGSPTYGYEIEILPDWIPDYSAYPDTIVWEVGEGGRLIVGVIQLNDEEGLLTNEDYANTALAGLESNFAEFSVTSELWSTSRNGYEICDVNFEYFTDGEMSLGTARVTIGTTCLLSVYYDDPVDFEFHLPDISWVFESIHIDEALINTDMYPDIPISEEPIEFINPFNIMYRNEVFFYTCINPPGLEPEEVTGAGWVVFSTGEGEIAIRYLDHYYGTGKTPDAFIEEMLPEIFNAFDRYEIAEDAEALMDDGRSAPVFRIDAIYNGSDWTGLFVGINSDNDEPFIISLLAPAEEFEKFAESFDAMWRSFTFDYEF